MLNSTRLKLVKTPNTILFLLIFITVVLSFHKLFYSSYMHHDDWIHAAYEGPCNSGPGVEWFLALGRPIGYQFICNEFRFIHTFKDAAFFRIINVFGFFLFLVLNFKVLQKIKSTSVALVFTLVIIPLPGFTVMLGWLGASLLLPSIIFSVLSFLSLLVYSSKFNNYVKALLVTFSLGAQTLSFLSYQTTSMIFIIYLYALFTVIKSDFSKKINLIMGLIVFFISLFIYILFFYFFSYSTLNSIDSERGDIKLLDFTRILKVLSEFIPKSLDLFIINTHEGYNYIHILILLVLSYAIIATKKLTTFFIIILALFFIMSTLITSNLQEYPYRVTLVASIFFVMLFFLHIENISKLLDRMLILVLPISLMFVIVVCNINVEKFLLLKIHESNFFNDKVRVYVQNEMKSNIIFKQPKNELPQSTDEFFRYTSEYDFDIIPALNFVFDDLKYPLPNIVIVPSSVDLQSFILESEERYIIDTNEIQKTIK